MKFIYSFSILILSTLFIQAQQDEVLVSVTATWVNGYSAKVEITPIGNVTNWEVKLNFTGNINYYSSWNSNAVLVGEVLTITPKDGYGAINAGTTVTLDFNGSDYNSLPTYLSHNFTLTNSNGELPVQKWLSDDQNINIYNSNPGNVLIGDRITSLSTSYYKFTVNGRANIVGSTNALSLWYPTLENNGSRHYMVLGHDKFSNGTVYGVIGVNEYKTSAAPKHLLLQTNSLNGGANVGIGNFSIAPVAKLTIKSGTNSKAFSVLDNNNQEVYRVTNEGIVYATEVQIKLKHEFPDYVFSKNYKLMSLDSLQAYIDTENHLPNIPAASELNNNIGVGELTRLQQEKIEELTLYILELKKRIELLENN